MKQPNFVFIMTDQHRADHLGCTGNTTVRTPNIDRLATSGTQFSRMYVANPVCMPNRASIMTGRMSSVHGGRDNGIPLSTDHTTFIEILRDAGYATSLIGKSHLRNYISSPPVHKFTPQPGLHVPSHNLQESMKRRRAGLEYESDKADVWAQPLMDRLDGPYYGFDHFEVSTGHGDEACGDYLVWARNQDPDIDQKRGPKNARPAEGFDAPQAFRSSVPTELHPTTWITERSIAKLKEHNQSDKPFFLQVSYPDPHHPFGPPGDYWGSYRPEDMVLPSSFGIGDIPAALKMRAALADGTAIRTGAQPFAVTEDEGHVLLALTYAMITMIDDAVGRLVDAVSELDSDRDTVIIFTSDHGEMMCDHGIMLKRYFHNQGVIKVPFIWNDQAHSKAIVSEDLCSSIDISASILARAGLQPFHGCQGRDIFSTDGPKGIVVEEDIRRPMIGTLPRERIRTFVTKDWRLTLRENDGFHELYNLVDDPDEITNQFGQTETRDIQAKLTTDMLQRVIELQDTSPLPTGRA